MYYYLNPSDLTLEAQNELMEYGRSLVSESEREEYLEANGADNFDSWLDSESYRKLQNVDFVFNP